MLREPTLPLTRPKLRRWLARHPRRTLHFTATPASRLNGVEGFFATLTRPRLERDVFHSVVDLAPAINHFLAEIFCPTASIESADHFQLNNSLDRWTRGA